jgi:hypothetical protein
MRTRWVVLLVVASNVLTLAIVFGTRWYDRGAQLRRREWHARLPGDYNDDHCDKMVDDLAENYVEIGMARADVLWLLGPPDSGQEASGARQLLGWDTGIEASDCRYFYVNFGPGGRTVVEWSGNPTG